MRSALIGLSLILGYFLLGPMPSGIGNERDSGGPVMRSRTLAARTDDEPETETNAEADDATLPGPEPDAPTTDDAPTNDDASTDAGAVDVDAADEGEKSSAGEPSAGISGRKREGSFRERHTSPAAPTKANAAADAEKDSKAEEDVAPPDPPGASLLAKIKQATVSIDRPEPAEYHDMRAGISTRAEMEKAWGAPAEVARQKDAVRHTYRIDAERVDVYCHQDVVQSLVVQYDQHPAWAVLSGQIGFDKIESVDIRDEFGELMGIALPENGVIIAFDSASKDRRVSQVIYEPVDAQSFALRAEQRMAKDFTGCQKDLEMAILVDPQFARAYWLRARVLKEMGRVDAATKALEAAVRLEPKSAEYRLMLGALFAEAGQFAKAIDETKQALLLCPAQPELRACALNQLGEQLASGPTRAYKQALPLHMQAIKLAEPLAQDRRTAVRDVAREALVTAHLSAARNIAWGNWKMKKKMVPAWLHRAEELVEQTAEPKQPEPEQMLRVYREALSACVGMEGDLDPTPWTEKALAAGTAALAQTTDPMRRRRLEWDLGAALYDALQVYHSKAEVAPATKYGNLAVEHLEAGAEERQLEPVEAYLLGRLYFRMGSVYAMHVKDAEQAVAWFERAIPLLERPVPATALSDAGHHGESFVSMAVSYWAAGNHEEAMRLTRQGVKLMEQAIKDGVLDDEALRVPYTNLATMHKYLGDDEQAEAFSDLAAKVSDSQRR